MSVPDSTAASSAAGVTASADVTTNVPTSAPDNTGRAPFSSAPPPRDFSDRFVMDLVDAVKDILRK